MTTLERAVIDAAREYCRTEAALPKPGSFGSFRKAEQALKTAVAAYEADLFSRLAHGPATTADHP